MSSRKRARRQGPEIPIESFRPAVLERLLSAQEIEDLAREHVPGYRARKLPASAVVQLMLTVQIWPGVTSLSEALRRAWEVVRAWVRLPLPRRRRGKPEGPVSTSALSQRQNTLPPEFFARVLGVLIERYRKRFGKPGWIGWCSRPLFALDATQVGRKKDEPKGSHAHGRKLQALLDLGSSLVTGWKITPTADHEIRSAKQVLHAGLPEASIVLFDRGYWDFGFFRWLVDRKHDFVTRLKKGCRFRSIRGLGAGDRLIEIGLGQKRTLRLRRVRVTPQQGATFYLLTSLVDPTAYPAQRIRELYIQRWQIEIMFRNLKHIMRLENTLARKPVGRANHVVAALSANVVVQYLRAEAAETNGTPIDAMSVRRTLGLLRIWLSANPARCCSVSRRVARDQVEDLIYSLATYSRKRKQRQPSEAGRREAIRA